MNNPENQNDSEAFPELNAALQKSRQEYENKIKNEQEQIQRNYEEFEKKKVEAEKSDDEVAVSSASKVIIHKIVNRLLSKP